MYIVLSKKNNTVAQYQIPCKNRLAQYLLSKNQNESTLFTRTKIVLNEVKIFIIYIHKSEYFTNF